MELILHNTITLLWIATVSYAMAFIFALSFLFIQHNYQRSIFYAFLSAGFIFQGLALYGRGLQLGTSPLTNPIEILQVIAWSSIFLILVIQIAFRLRLLGFFGTLLVTALSLVSLLFFNLSEYPTVTSMAGNPWIEFHAGLAVFAYASFGLLAITSFMFLLQDYALAHKIFGFFFSSLPSLKQLDAISQRLLLIGVISLTVSVGIGFLTWLSEASSVSLGKIITAAGLLLCYLSLLILKSKHVFSLRIYAWSTFILFILAIISLWPVQS